MKRGVTLVEVIVAIAIVALFSMIIISNFPGIERRLSLSRATYKLAQDIRSAQGMALSGVQIENSLGEKIEAKGYGFYVNLAYGDHKKYGIYADVDGDEKYSLISDVYCEDMAGSPTDCIIQKIDLNEDEPSVNIKKINNVDSQWVSINFSPPNPKTNIANLASGQVGAEIILSLDADESIARSVFINTSGLIEIRPSAE